MRESLQKTLSTTCTTPFEASLSTSIMWDTASTLVMVTWLGKAVTVTLSPAPVTRGVGPGGKSRECRAPRVTCLKSTDCRATRSDNRALNVFGDIESKAAFVGAKSVIGPG